MRGYNRLAVLLYYITDRKAFATDESSRREALLRRIADAARAGIDYIQLREKDLESTELELLARELLRRIRDNSSKTKLLINTHVEIALAIGADGVHLPAGSSPPGAIRAAWLYQVRRDPVIGVSAHSVNDVLDAERGGATFAVLAPIFEKARTGSKPIGIDTLREACAASQVPVLALGGVRPGNVRACLEAGAAGIAGIRLFQENAVSQTVEALRWLEQNVSHRAG